MFDPQLDLRTLSHPAQIPECPGWSAAPCARARRGADGLIELQLSGPLPADWSLSFCRSLAARGAGLQRGHARRIAGDAWMAELGIDDRRSQPLRPEELCALPRGPMPQAPLPEPRILDFELGHSPLHGGSLVLEVDAWDAVGLLAAVLACARRAGLSPVELILVTEEECAFHKLSLRGRGGGTPTRRERRALALAMSGMLGG